MSDTQGADPMDVLMDVVERVERIESLIKEQQNLRLNIGTNTRFRSVAEFVKDNQPCTSADLEGDVVNNATRALTTMYYAGYVNRDGPRPYEYMLSETGKEALRKAREQEQSELPDHGDEKIESTSPDPWEGSDASESEYKAIKLVAEYDGHPQSPDIADEFEDFGYSTSGNSIAQLSTALDKGYVDRTPEPHSYWVTEKGEELLED